MDEHNGGPRHANSSDTGFLCALGEIGGEFYVLIGLKVDTADSRRRLASFLGRDGVREADIDVSFPDGGGAPGVGRNRPPPGASS